MSENNYCRSDIIEIGLLNLFNVSWKDIATSFVQNRNTSKSIGSFKETKNIGKYSRLLSLRKRRIEKNRQRQVSYLRCIDINEGAVLSLVCQWRDAIVIGTQSYLRSGKIVRGVQRKISAFPLRIKGAAAR